MCDRLCPIFGTHGHLWDGDEDSSRDSYCRVREVETMSFDDVLSYAETGFLGRLYDVPKEDFLGLIHSDPKFQHLCELLIYQPLIEDGQPITENRNRFVRLLRSLLVEGMSTEDRGCFLAVLLVAYQICFHPLNLEWFRNFPGCYLIASQPRWVINFPTKEQACLPFGYILSWTEDHRILFIQSPESSEKTIVPSLWEGVRRAWIHFLEHGDEKHFS